MKKPPAIVIKLDCRTGLQTSRALSGYGIPVIGVVDDPLHFCSRTNSCEEIIATDTSGERLIETLLALRSKFEGKAVLFPCSDESVRVISADSERLREFYSFVLPDEDVLSLFMDKMSFYKYAQEKGFPIPRTFFPVKKKDLDDIVPNIKFPAIIKPAVRKPVWFKYFPNKVVKVKNSRELYEVFDKCLTAAERVIVQEWICGGDSNLFSTIFYYDSSCRPVITFTSRKLRQWHIEEGDASLAVECKNEEILNLSLELLDSVRFKGLGSIEFKMQDSSGEYFITEPNLGRPVSRIGLVERAGIELFYTMYSDALGWELPANTKQLYKGVKWIYINNDIRSAVAYNKKGELSLWEWFVSVRDVRAFAVLSLRDPLPFLIETKNRLKNVLWPLLSKIKRYILEASKGM